MTVGHAVTHPRLALQTSDKVSRLPEQADIVGFYLFGSVPEPWTIYQEVRSYQWVDATGPHAPVQYFSISEVWAEASQTDQVEGMNFPVLVRNAVLDSVRAHRVADVPVGAFQSAGIDSGALVGLMSELNTDGPPINTITLAFDEFRDTHDDESLLAGDVAHLYGTQHTSRFVDEAEFREDLSKIFSTVDQPSIGTFCANSIMHNL